MDRDGCSCPMAVCLKDRSKRDGVGVMSEVDGMRYEGEFRDQPWGLGAQWDKGGKLTHCGRCMDFTFIESCPVPLRLISQGKYLSAAGLTPAAHRALLTQSVLSLLTTPFFFCVSLSACAAQKIRRDHPAYSLVMLDDEGGFFIGEANSRGEPHGQGVAFHPDGSVLHELLVDSADAADSGRWIDGNLNGRAAQLLRNGDRYVGYFKNSRCDGLGVYNWMDGSRYEGELAAGNRSGLGAGWD